jgi:hypothetical protein
VIALVPALAGALIVAGLIGVVAAVRPTAVAAQAPSLAPAAPPATS